MAKMRAVTEALKTLAQVETYLGLVPHPDPDFFGEWRRDLPELSGGESNRLRILGERLRYHRGLGELLEGAVMLLVASPLLELAGFYDPPFRLQAEAAVELVIDDGEEILRGRIDALILQEQFWVLVLEAKKTTIPTRSALPQALAYMLANHQPQGPTFGMITNGDDVLFIKLSPPPQPQYSLSRTFSLYTLPTEAQTVLQILKYLGEAITII